MKFFKMEGAGNDYVYVDLFQEAFPHDVDELARRVSHRHFGIGSDGLVLIGPADGHDAEMIMFNPDGSKSEMCGNALRCVARHVREHYAEKDELTLKTGAGTLYATVLRNSHGGIDKIRIDMGKPILEGLQIPTTWDMAPVVRQTIEVGDRNFECTCVSMGNPHCVILVDDVEHFPVEKYGPLLEHHPRFPRRVNVEFVQVVDRGHLVQRTWERGAGETWACGTGASAVCVAGVLNDVSDRKVSIQLLGGVLELEWLENGPVLMAGPATHVFEGDYPW